MRVHVMYVLLHHFIRASLLWILIWYLFIGNLKYYIFSPIKRKEKVIFFINIFQDIML